MSSDIPAVSELVPGVPKIVITAPSPQAVKDAPIEVPITRRTSDPRATTPVTDPPQPPDSAEETIVHYPRNTSFSASEGFVPMEDSTEVQVEEDDFPHPTTDPGVAEQQVTRDDLRRRSFRDRAFDCFRCGVCRNPNAKVYLFYALLLIASIATLFMGAWHMEKCPLNAAIPRFLFMMGVLGCVVVLCRLIPSQDHSERYSMFNVLPKIAVFGKVTIVLLLVTEIVSFVQLSPSFHPGDPNYCYRIFYDYTFWLNWCGLIFLVIFLPMCLYIHAPRC